MRAALSALGYDKIALETLKENSEALDFWTKQGFSPIIERESSQYGRVSLLMERDI
jgi:ribosomal protein S18 acetylase RimI-like enzyme